MIFKGKRVAVFVLGVFCLSPIFVSEATRSAGDWVYKIDDIFSLMRDEQDAQEYQSGKMVAAPVRIYLRQALKEMRVGEIIAQFFVSASQGANMNELGEMLAKKFEGSGRSSRSSGIKSLCCGMFGFIDGLTEILDEDNTQADVVTKEECFGLLAAYYLCGEFLPLFIQKGLNGIRNYTDKNPMDSYKSMRWAFLKAAKEAYGIGSQRYKETEQGLSALARSGSLVEVVRNQLSCCSEVVEDC